MAHSAAMQSKSVNASSDHAQSTWRWHSARWFSRNRHFMSRVCFVTAMPCYNAVLHVLVDLHINILHTSFDVLTTSEGSDIC